MEYYFDTDDKLNRLRYAEFLKSLLENCDKYRREDSDGAYVIAIDSPWGTGKTRFAKMLRNYLENRTSDTPAEAPIDPSDGFLTVYYNAWDTDFSNDALEPLIYTLINSPEFESKLFEQQADEEIGNFIDTAKKVLKVIGLSAAHHFFGETAAKAIDVCIENDDSKEDEICDYERKRETIQEFRETLIQVAEKTNKKKIVIIIDELDRCRPTFAIQTLELAKHLFAVKGLIFIFALDIKQLSCSVKTIYGQDLDAPGYLCRFFDYVSKMPKPPVKEFIDDLLGQIQPLQQFYKFFEFKTMLTMYIWSLFIIHSLSLRDVLSLISTYRILFAVCLVNYPDFSAHQLYLYLLLLKLKKSNDYEQLLNGSINDDEIRKNYQENILLKEGSNDNGQSRRFQLLGANRRIRDTTYMTFECISGETQKGRLFTRFLITGNANNPDMKYFINTGHPQEAGGYEFKDTENLEQVLYYEDLKKWDQIKHLTLGQYYYQQLEMFNFALPADNTEPEA